MIYNTLRQTGIGTRIHSQSRYLSTPSDFSNRIKGILRQIPRNLVVIATKDGELNRGLLVSSFNSVTLHPIPYVSFNIHAASPTWMAMQTSGCFTASLINDERVARAFAEKASGDWSTMLDHEARIKTEFGLQACLNCELQHDSSISLGDHVIVVGRVIDAAESGAPSGPALVHWQQRFSLLGQR